MSRKSDTIEQVISKLLEAEVLLGQGQTVGDVCRSFNISEQTYYRWQKEYGGIRTDQVCRLKELEKENTGLKKLVADLSLDNSILQETVRGNWSARPGAGRWWSTPRKCSRYPNDASAGHWNNLALLKVTVVREPMTKRCSLNGSLPWPARMDVIVIAHYGHAADGRLTGQLQARGACLAAGRAEKPRQAAQTRQIVAERWLLPAAEARIP